MIILYIITGVLLADVVSAFIHWGQDNLGNPTTFLVGHIIQDGIRHHEDPLLFTRSSVLKRSWLPFMGALMFFMLGTWVWGFNPVVTSASVAGALLVEIQVLAHKENIPKWARALQYVGIVQRPQQHEKHHTGERQSYAVITNWLNPALDASGLWTWLARVFKV